MTWLAPVLALVLVDGCSSAKQPTNVEQTVSQSAARTTSNSAVITNSAPISAESQSAVPSIVQYLGGWRIVRFEKPESSLVVAEAIAESQLGKMVVLRGDKVTFDKSFLWTDSQLCEPAKLEWATGVELEGHASQALLPLDHPEKREGDPLFLDVICNGRVSFGAEVTRHNELMAYYDGYKFFLDRD
jgi:hypothetical protein